MARKDALTGRGPLSGNNRSHALNATKRKWNLNLQKVKVVDEKGNIKTVKVSTRTLRTLKKTEKLV
ncbi:50S ribosomal protein L28 [Mesoplasma sp. JKS002658]|uniref:50S ribosomal protein L28 n=1 Tax=Mesoplasma whartonense TaxID=2878854 RepID=UPI000A27DB9C|nr:MULTISPECIES: 50S ribosomal protein L28 [unclassified Mesoplasma]MCL8211503.1 50S ribosomal protein L28 [Mesoplasma sp. JKS002664]MCL8211963.1 50S ribosomal protein L28 [Mesoplasma sp. JKS002662]MCL8212998.1 50S ribosomal protein L28 [Mesoplasma sp. JKS002661]MCL8213583.1 50S ribosomal protein L28 [Mesoplasma sp. JKS002660]MCL8213932.1 50S ribosomal protein L28 [Mesoplasma sp. JKS002658]